MSTKDTEKTESATTTPENEPNDNKKVFGPLGKYAVVAVIMVSIIVTTAIMLNKQLGTVEEQLAAMESEVAEINDANTNSHESTLASDTATDSAAIIEVAKTEAAKAELALVAEASELAAVEAPAATEEPVATEKPVATEDSVRVADVADTDAQNSAIESAPLVEVSYTPSAGVESAAFDMEHYDQDRQARIEAFKAEQKQRMTEMFTRIKTLEAQRLNEYKNSQDQQIERLREQIAKQEKMIEALILRNQEWIEMREASIQRSQSKRAEMLERI